MDIEVAISAHPDVAAVAVTAGPDERLGESLGAWLVLRPGVNWSGQDTLVRHLESIRLAQQKIPTYWQIVEALPSSASGKVRNQELVPATEGVSAEKP